MANNYTQATVSPTNIPESLFTEKELEQLDYLGFSYQKNRDSDTLYFFVEEGFVESDEDEDGIEVNAFKIFQEIITRSLETPAVESLRKVVIEGAYTCSKMRPGEFGGFVVRVTKDNVQFSSTDQMLRLMREEV